ncbi:hypothetical protein [Paracoccus sp. ME4]|uniref:hypothetical protein n=1 Tax=Paracoccus sp. ME4 TaxID=3138066 RepID=UPI00398B209D
MSIDITKKTITAMAKSVTGDMKHTQKLDAFARVLGYKDQTALMGMLKAQDAAAAPQPASAPTSELEVLHGEKALARLVEAALIRARDGWNEDDWRSDWRYEVDNGDTNQGYSGWGESMVEQRGEDITSDIISAMESLVAGPRDGETEEDVQRKAAETLVWAMSQLTEADEPDCFNADANEAIMFVMAALTTPREPAFAALNQVAASFLDRVEFDPARQNRDTDPNEGPQP